MSMEEKHCCTTMDRYLDSRGREELLEYERCVRQYRFFLRCKGKLSPLRQPLLYCPWCGKKLPEELPDKMEEVLEKEYGITEKDWDAPGWNDDIHLPPEFRTDEWWKKRGL